VASEEEASAATITELSPDGLCDTQKDRCTEAEQLMDDKMSALGVSWFQACMVIFVLLVYAADGAEVTVMSLVARELGVKFSLQGWQTGLLGSSVYSGMFMGGLGSGPIADTKGRSFTLIGATLLISVFGVLSAYAPTFGLLCLARFIAGIGMGASLPVSSSLLQETVPYAWKGALACLVFAGFNIGEFFAARMGVFAFLRPDPSTWLFLVAALPAIVTYAISLAVPESPRFLASRGKAEEVANWFKRAAGLNRKPIEEVFPEGVTEGSKKLCYAPMEVKSGGKRDAIRRKLTDIFAPGGLRLRTSVLWILWMAANSCFYGMIFSLPGALRHVKAVAAQPAFDVARGISQVSAYQTIAFLLYMPLVALGVKYKKLFPATFVGAFAAFASVLLAIGGGALTPARLVLSLAFAKFFYNGIFMMLYPLTGTSYPTAIRATGVGLAGTVGRICTIMVAPVCTRLQEISPLLPYQAFTGITALAFLASLLL
jgi:putative MFS transporter